MRECKLTKGILLAVGICILSLGTFLNGTGQLKINHAFIKLYATNKTVNGMVKNILLWNRWSGHGMWQSLMRGKSIAYLNCLKLCTVHRYPIKNNTLFYDAVLFNGRTKEAPPEHRHSSQVYVIYIKESPETRPPYIKGDYFYNWTATYDSRSDIWIPIWITKRKTLTQNMDENHLPPIRYKNISADATVVWVVSHCRTHGKREKYVSYLKEYLKVDVYGGCGKPCFKHKRLPGAACLKALAESGKYKFYLSFENAVCREYITEKVQRPLRFGLVPIVYGGKEHKEYVDRLPPNSFIDVRNFTSPKHLATYIKYLLRNKTAYMSYHEWRSIYEIEKGNSYCELCNAIHNVSMTNRQSNINFGLFWNRFNNCVPNFLSKVLSHQ